MDAAALDGTISIMKSHLCTLESKRTKLEQKISAAKRSIAVAERERDGSDQNGLGKRRRKGENLRAVRSVLLAAPEGLSQKEIADRANINVSSVQAVLAKHAEQFQRETDGSLYVLTQSGRLAARVQDVSSSEDSP
jgi:hypothetical protein